jgi:hypothetical protein
MKNPGKVRVPGDGRSRAVQRNGPHMVALTVIIGAAVFVVLVVAVLRALRRASQQIDDIFHEELDDTDEQGESPPTGG